MSKNRIIAVVVLGLLVVGAQVPAARADFTFGPRVNLDLGPPVNSPQNEGNPVISRNGLELYFYSTRPGGYGGDDVWVCKRASVEDPWGLPVNLGPGINSAGLEVPESISSDGLTLHITVGTSAPDADMYTATRPALDAPWGPRISMGPVLNSASDLGGISSPDDLELYFPSNRAGGMGAYDIYVSTRATRNDPWGPPANLGLTINTPSNDSPASMSPDGKILFIVTNRPGGFGSSDTWMARRPFKGAAWSEPVNLGPSFNTPNNEDLSWVSADGRWAYAFDGAVAGPGNMWMAPIIPIVDFNGDGKVDGKEVLALAQHWGQSQRLLDIGLSPMGDGIVDVNDLTALAGYIGQDVNDPTLIAHWALDEAEGTTAADSVGNNNLAVVGNAAWQPAGGKIGGALAFDGKDDSASSGSVVLDPAQGPFSVIAWVKGGAPNKVIVSQAAGADWLYLNQYGMLTTDLKASGREGRSLTSDAYVLDDQWHRVALVWDGTNRALQMDGVEVGEDTQAGLAARSGNLLIGAGNDSSTFWTGLIDDVRIYNRAVQP